LTHPLPSAAVTRRERFARTSVSTKLPPHAANGLPAQQFLPNSRLTPRTSRDPVAPLAPTSTPPTAPPLSPTPRQQNSVFPPPTFRRDSGTYNDFSDFRQGQGINTRRSWSPRHCRVERVVLSDFSAGARLHTEPLLEVVRADPSSASLSALFFLPVERTAFFLREVA
jgi:hypothetical protein